METKDLTVSQTTEVAKRQTTEVAHRKGELAQRPSMQESGQKALPGSDGVEDAEFMDVTDCRESGGWFEFLSFLFKKRSTKGKLSRRIRNKCVSGKELTKAECLELIHSGNIQYFCTLVPNPGWKGPSGLPRSDWGEGAITVFRTMSGSPYRFQFHISAAESKAK